MKPLVPMIALPVLCILAGYGAGQFLTDGAAIAEPAPSAAETAAPDAPLPEAPIADADADESKLGHSAVGGHGATPPPVGVNANIVPVGAMTVPVQKPRSVTYVVADFAVAFGDPTSADHFRLTENTIQLRDAILASLTKAAATPALAGASIDTDALSATIQQDLHPRFAGISDVLFLTFYKQDVARNRAATSR